MLNLSPKFSVDESLCLKVLKECRPITKSGPPSKKFGHSCESMTLPDREQHLLPPWLWKAFWVDACLAGIHRKFSVPTIWDCFKSFSDVGGGDHQKRKRFMIFLPNESSDCLSPVLSCRARLSSSLLRTRLCLPSSSGVQVSAKEDKYRRGIPRVLRLC